MIKNVLPREIKKVFVPPLKCQGIKTKLVPFIAGNIQWVGEGRWIEPFLGSGVVAFNLAPKQATLSDNNKHIINLYRAIQNGQISEPVVRDRLTEMGAILKKQGESYFYEVRDRFNSYADPLDLLFLNRSCFNGVMRFNSKGKYNVPFGKKTERFRKAYITKIVNQIRWLRRILKENQWQFECFDWKACLADVKSGDFVYFDPPYIGRHTDYFNKWDELDAEDLARVCHSLPCGYALSMWKANKYRENRYLENWLRGEEIRTFNHFYHVGSRESLRNEMTEALVIKKDFAASAEHWSGKPTRKERISYVQSSLFDNTSEGGEI